MKTRSYTMAAVDSATAMVRSRQTASLLYTTIIGNRLKRLFAAGSSWLSQQPPRHVCGPLLRRSRTCGRVHFRQMGGSNKLIPRETGCTSPLPTR